MKSDKMCIEDLLSDESFINYCKKSSTEDIAFWETYLKENPESQLLIEEAKAVFIQLFNVLAISDRDEQEMQLRNKLNKIESTPIVQIPAIKEKNPKNIFTLLKISTAAAVLIAAVFFGIKYYNNGSKKESTKTFMAACGERKGFQLPDGSVVTLNGGSKIEIKESFGVSTRDIYLEGEAFFDVKHNKDLPFIVHTPAMDVEAVGTAFNVKAYPGERITETSLVRGLVEITLKDGNRKMLLHPNEKVQWERPGSKVSGSSTAKAKKEDSNSGMLMEKLVTNDEGDVKEIAWKENKLIFDGDSFEDIAILLERWYGVKISIEDDAIRHYPYTVTFEKEDLITVLNYFKEMESRGFNYEIEEGKVNIHK
jgi:ferric-dicitrate binding protein FerR (iron transport regulator)